MDSRILPADLPNNKLNDYFYEQGFDEEFWSIQNLPNVSLARFVKESTEIQS